MKRYILLFLFISSVTYSQQNYQCGMTESYTETYPQGYQVNPPQIGGQLAPAKTLNGSYMRIFIVFAQFKEIIKTQMIFIGNQIKCLLGQILLLVQIGIKLLTPLIL